MDDDIKWTTEGDVVTEALLEGSAMVAKEETSVRVERAIAFLDTWMGVEPDSTSVQRYLEKTPTLTSISISAVTIHWNTGGES